MHTSKRKMNLMDERFQAQLCAPSRLSWSSYKHNAAFPTRTKTRVFLHWRPSRTLTFTRCAGPKFILMNWPGKQRTVKKQMKSTFSQPALGHRVEAIAQLARTHVDA